MRKGKAMLRWARIMVLAVAVFGSVYGIAVSNSTDSSGSRADIINIDILKIFGDLERPEVVFLHDKHTEALEKEKKDCSTCHLSEKNFEVIPETMKEAVRGIDRLSPKFKRLKDAGRKEVMDVYHDNCIECHKQMKADGNQSGPVICAGCHKESPEVRSSRLAMGFDKSLHFRHVKAKEKKCEICHHEYDAEKKKLFYAKEKEGTCRYCHKADTEGNRISMRLASHLQCVRCHQDELAKKNSAGPIKCAGCHAPENQAKIEKIADIPRMERKQPDSVIVQTGLRDTEKDRKVTRMGSVPFDHKIHEERNDNCRVCHHAALDSCSKCHTLRGAKEGDGIKLELAMHLSSKEKSCIGCHTIRQADKNCAGCHAPIEKGRMPEASCDRCHMDMPEGLKTGGDKKPDMKALAKTMLDSRPVASATYADEDIPDKVVIDMLVDQYEAVELPHRKIVKTLVKNIKDNKLAAYFHKDQGTVCQGCHHNSPVSKKPPRCGNCHGRPFDKNSPNAPGLTGAYHQQCMGCHKVMELEKPAGCTSCHKEKQAL